MNHIQKDIPDKRELIVAKGCHKTYPFVCIGLYRAKGCHRFVVTMTGRGYPWSSVSKWAYLRDALPDYNIWAPDPSRNILSDGDEQYMATSGV